MSKKPIDKRTTQIVKDVKMRGGRVNQVMKDKTKYDRKSSKKEIQEDCDD